MINMPPPVFNAGGGMHYLCYRFVQRCPQSVQIHTGDLH